MKLIVSDTGDSAEKAKNAAQRLVAQSPDVVGAIGAWLSSFTLTPKNGPESGTTSATSTSDIRGNLIVVVRQPMRIEATGWLEISNERPLSVRCVKATGAKVGSDNYSCIDAKGSGMSGQEKSRKGSRHQANDSPFKTLGPLAAGSGLPSAQHSYARELLQFDIHSTYTCASFGG
jgi:hypothetical protein